MLQRVAKDLSFAEEGRDEILQLDQFGPHELDGIMSEIYLPTAPTTQSWNCAFFQDIGAGERLPCEQTVDLAQQEGSCALPPVGRKTPAKMANSIMIEFALEGEEQKAVLVRAICLWAALKSMLAPRNAPGVSLAWGGQC